MPADRERRAMLRARLPCVIVVGSFLMIATGCATQDGEIRRDGEREREAKSQALQGRAGGGENHIQAVAYLQPPRTMQQNDKSTGEHEKKANPAGPAEKITLPLAIELCVNNNFRVRAAAERIRIADADLITSSLIPNSSMFADNQLIPLQRADLLNQLGPPQYDAILSVPIDWLVFGKRVAAMKAAKIGIDVSAAEFADALRVQLAQENHAELKKIEDVTNEMIAAKKIGNTERDRVKLAVLEAYLEIHSRQLALAAAKARMRPLVGRTARDADFEVVGVLAVKAVVPPPKLEDAVALADEHRPDLHTGRRAVDHARAVVELERRRARPQVSIQPGWSYQDQVAVNGFRNGSMLDIGIVTTLPFTDRNQGNIRKAQVQAAERQFNYEAERAEALA